MQRPSVLTQFVVLLGLGIACVPVFLLLMPNVEATRTEARLLITYNEVHRLRYDHQRALEASGSETLVSPDAGTGSTVRLPETDPWGQHYRLVSLGGSGTEQFRVHSSGPNMSSPLRGMDADDIYSGMPVSPLEPIYKRKTMQWLIALAATALSWASLSAIYLRWQFHHARR